MTLSFVGQDLRNQSFRGRKDLAGADFTGADLRGCDFRYAILIGANFTGTKTGKSRKQLVTLIASATASATVSTAIISGLLARPFVRAVTDEDAVGVVLTVLLVSSFASLAVFAFEYIMNADVVVMAIAFSIVSALWVSCVIAIAVQAYSVFLLGKISDGIAWSFFSITALVMTVFLLGYLIEIIKCTMGTNFRGANLTRARFINAKLIATDFRAAKTDLVHWQGASFQFCEFSQNIKDEEIRFLCSQPLINRRKNYAFFNLYGLYLQNINLVDSILRNANLNGSDLRGANLINADLSNSQALGTDFSGATLTGARIANWGINSETKFENVICKHVYIDEAGKERKPSSGEFKEGDFALLVGEFTNTLDFLFKNEINFSAFQYAMQQMLIKNPEVEISLNQTKFLGRDKNAFKRSYDILNPETDKEKLHADFSGPYDDYKRNHPEDNQLIRDLNRQVTYLEGEIKTLKVLNAEKDERIIDLKESNVGFKEIAKTQATKSNDKITVKQVQGDHMTEKTENKEGITITNHGSMKGFNVAAGDISGIVKITIQELRDSDTPEAPKIADLLTELQKLINESPDLTEIDKEKALKYIDTIGKLASNKEDDHDMISLAINKVLDVVRKASELFAPVQGIVDNLLTLLQL